jgi:hypothetical protein
LARVAGQPTLGVMKDVVTVGGYQEVEIDFVANNPGLTPFHCHQQLHMDFGFMTLFDYTVQRRFTLVIFCLGTLWTQLFGSRSAWGNGSDESTIEHFPPAP